MCMTMNRDDAPSIVYVVFDVNGLPINVYHNEDDAYEYASDDSRVVTYKKA